MTNYQKMSLFLLRVSLGWMFFYAGITKVLNPTWSAGGFLGSAKTFGPLFSWFAQPNILPVTNFLNEWGLTLLGISLILGIGVRLSAALGAMLMLLYYLPILDFPHPNPQSYIVDQHIIYIFSLLVLGAFRSGRVMGLENWCSNMPICSRYPALRKLLG